MRSRKLKILEDDFTARSDFAECFGAEASREVQCAEIQTSEMRHLRRCVGLRCDVALWAALASIVSKELPLAAGAQVQFPALPCPEPPQGDSERRLTARYIQFYPQGPEAGCLVHYSES